ncbi:MAG: hypothetical protein DME19_02590 [Verrucomicrobia bacterium]|nr:MAG: hypothetical protein DME19_02590 [Verrucomicrobiota bacterium]
MKTRESFLLLVIGLCLVAGPVIPAQSDQTTSTNSLSTRTPPPLPPLPPSFRLPTNAPPNRSLAQSTNRQQLLQAIRPGNTTGAPVSVRVTNFAVQPFSPSSAFRPAFTNRPAQPLPLAADAELKEYTARPGETNAQFTFTLTNTSPNEITINDVRTSCGCTVAKLPSYPWILAPGTNGQIHVTVDLRGKRGQLTKLVYVYGATGTKTLTVKANIPEAAPGVMADRSKNIQIATADRQAVFKNECANCHSVPAVGKKGEMLYLAVCANCHDSEHRASMVPNLRALNHPTDREQWKNWVTHGKNGTLMPAFAKAEGGPLSEEQINSLVDYLAEHIPSRPAAVPSVPSARLPASQ